MDSEEEMGQWSEGGGASAAGGGGLMWTEREASHEREER